MRRLRLDAHRGLGRQHGHPRPGRPGVRHAAALRAGRRPRAAADELRRQRRGPLRARIRRSLRRAVLVHPLRRQRRTGRSKRPSPKPGRIRAVPERLAQRTYLEITFPRLLGYRYELPPEHLEARFTDDSRVVLSTADMPTKTENAPIVGETSIHTLDDLKKRREQRSRLRPGQAGPGEIFPAEDGEPAPNRTAQPARQRRPGLAVPAGAGDRQALAGGMRRVQGPHVSATPAFRSEGARGRREDLPEHRGRGLHRPPASRRSCGPTTQTGTTAVTSTSTPPSRPVRTGGGQVPRLARRLRQRLGDEVGPGAGRHGRGDRPTSRTRASGSRFPTPSRAGRRTTTRTSRPHRRRPRPGDLLNLIVEISGEKKKEKEAKVETARKLWVPAVNNQGTFGRWAFLEISDPWDAEHAIRAFLDKRKGLKTGAGRNPPTGE